MAPMSAARDAGAVIVAASFLSRFATKNYSLGAPRCGGQRFRGGSKEKGATGRPVGLLLFKYLLDRAGEASV